MDPFSLRRPESDKYCYTGICREGERGDEGNSAGGNKRLTCLLWALLLDDIGFCSDLNEP